MNAPTPPAEVLAYRLNDAAKVVGVSGRKLWDLLAPRGPIPVVRVGRSVLIPAAGLRAWLTAEAAESSASVPSSEGGAA